LNDERHTFSLQSLWTGGGEGDGTLSVNGRAVDYGVPEGLGGKPGRTNPEELLLGAVASCYSITFGILAERRRLPMTKVELEASAEVIRQPGGTLKYTAIHLRPKITMTAPDDVQRATALDSAHKAEQYCVISNAIRGNVTITVEPEIITD
jgi:peroxiredoxin-like protein